MVGDETGRGAMRYMGVFCCSGKIKIIKDVSEGGGIIVKPQKRRGRGNQGGRTSETFFSEKVTIKIEENFSIVEGMEVGVQK